VARIRKGDAQLANQELSEYLASRSDGKPQDWSARVGAFLLGRLPESDFVAAATSSDVRKNRDQHCEALYYSGLKQLLTGDKKSAANDFTQSLATLANNLSEFGCARFELESLNVTQRQ